jgi:hypothetical protein
VSQAFSVDVDAAPVRAAFASLRVRLATGLSSAWARLGARAEDAASPYVPIESGRLIDSLHAEASAAGVEFGSSLVYAGVQDRGWPGHNIEGHHFMDRAADAIERDADDVLEPAIQQLINAVGLR